MSNSVGATSEINSIFEDYFGHLLKEDGEEFSYALELMVDDLHKNKEKTVNQFMFHTNVDAFLFALLKLLGNDNLRVAGNTAYILGCLAESQHGCYRLLSTVTTNKKFKVLHSLVKMLSVSDGETVMNAAGTIGTLAESKEGRDWILGEDCLQELIEFCSGLLDSENNWTGSNAALVLARLSISEQGCQQLSGHPTSAPALVSRLCRALGCDDAGRGMNAAFALGRIADSPAGADLLARQEAAQLSGLVRDLAGMTRGNDSGSAKNACFCLSCLAGSEFGHGLVLADADIAAKLIAGLGRLVTGSDEETAWFAALAIRILSAKPPGAKFVRHQSQVVATLQAVVNNPDVSPDLKDEVSCALEFLKPIEKPFPPMVEVHGCHELRVRWLAAETKTGFPVTYELHCDQGLVYKGDKTEFALTRLSPSTSYAFRVRVCTEADRSQFSEAIVACTDEAASDSVATISSDSIEQSVSTTETSSSKSACELLLPSGETALVAAPSKPTNLRLLASTATQLKVAWDPPDRGTVRTYIVYCEGRQVDCTTEQTSIISGLSPCTEYNVQVCASSSKGKSERAACRADTLELGAHAPPKPQVTVLGRHEMSVTWEAPEQPLGRINHYQVLLNGKKSVYSGTDMSCKIASLTADTEYLVTVVVVTNEGKAESKPAKKRTAKDEFDPQRQPLWAPNRPSLDSAPPMTSSLQSLTEPDVPSRRGSVAKIEPRTLKPLKPDQQFPARRRSLPPPIDAKTIRDSTTMSAITTKPIPTLLSTLTPTTLVLDRFGLDGGSRLKRVTAEDAKASVHLSGWSAPQAILAPAPAPAPVPPPLAEASAADDESPIDASTTAARPLSQLLPSQAAPGRVNARPELAPLPEKGGGAGVAESAGQLSQQQLQQQQQQHKQQKRQRARNSNRRSKESVWLQSRSL